MFSGRLSVRLLSVNNYFMRLDISVLNGGISIKFNTNILHVSRNC